MVRDTGTIKLEGTVTRHLKVDGDMLTTCALATPDRRAVAVESTELSLILDASIHRYDFSSWRWTRYGAEGVADGLHLPDYDDSSWARVPVLHPIYDMRYSGHAWFREEFSLPREHAEESVTIMLGGMDDEDWDAYRVFLNGQEIGAWSGHGRWREPQAITLTPGEEDYSLLRFDAPNLLAFETRDLARTIPNMLPEEAEHYFFQGWLLDQFVTIGAPYRHVRDFRVVDIRESSGRVEADVRAEDVAATLRYEVGEDGHLRKSVTLTNEGSEPLRVLDVILEELHGDFADPSKGGRGHPILAGDLFFGLEHPAGLNQGDAGLLRGVQLAGVTVEPDDSLTCAPTVLGAAAPDQQVDDAFRSYVLALRPRREQRLSIYDTLGWTDYASGAAERPRLTEPLFHEVVAKLEELRARGIELDLFEFADWFDPTDFLAFSREHFPNGSVPLAKRLREAGMGVSLWSATTQAAWSSHEVEGLDAAVAGGVSPTIGFAAPPDEVASWDWDVVFSHVSMGGMRYCPAAEPFRSHLRASLVQHAADTDAEALKLDCAVLHCTASHHGHMPGRHSVHAIHDVMRNLVDAVRQDRPELFVIWYWGFQSPWWLQHGDAMFDKGLKLEAASPASSPAPAWRPAVNLTADQAVRHASLIPFSLQDSLGVWIGEVPWANWMGKADWRDAWVLEVARGGTVLSLWGDVWMFDDDDLDFLASVLAHVRRQGSGFLQAVAVGGDPWRSEPYGYAEPRSGGGAVVTAYNPTFFPRSLALDGRGLPGVPVQAELVVEELYPAPGHVSTLSPEGSLDLDLLPWEVRCLEVRPGEASASKSGPAQLEQRETITIDVFGPRQERELPDGEQLVEFSGATRCPDVEPGDVLVVWVRISRDGAWRYHPEPQSLVELALTVDGVPVDLRVTPSIRSWNGPGCPWITYSTTASPEWAGARLEARLSGRLPSDLAIEEAGCLVYGGQRRGPQAFGSSQ